MRRLVKHILCTLLMLVAFSAAGQDRRIDEQLHMYEDMCEQCMDIKSKAASGENVKRSTVEALIDGFLSQNKALKAQEGDMTAAQRHRFAAIGGWFSTGVRPEIPSQLPIMQECFVLAPVPVLQSTMDCMALFDKPDFWVDTADLQNRKPVSASNLRGDFFIMASLAAPDMSYGLMLGWLPKRFGPYACFRSNFVSSATSYTCGSDGIMPSGSRFWPSGQQRRSNLSVTAGLLIGTTDWLTFNLGAGYGYRNMAWEDTDGQWALVSDWSRSGFAAECGVVVSVRKLALSAGVSTVAFRTAAFTCGVGVRF